MDFLDYHAYTQNMKKYGIALILIIAFASLSLSADRVYWYTDTSSDARTDNGAIFSNTAYNAASNDYKLNSVIEITDNATGETVVVMVNNRLPSTVEGRTIAITEAAAKELGIYEKGIADVSVRLIRGEILLDGIEKDLESGWYSYDLGLFDSDRDAGKVYTRLIRNGLKPKAISEDGKVRLIIPYVREFDRESAEIAIALSGVAEPKASKTESPFV